VHDANTESDADPGRWMTYAEAAAALGSTPEAIRKQARRGGWAKQRPNSPGTPARVHVPQALLEAPPGRPPQAADAAALAAAHAARADAAEALATAVAGHVSHLRAQLGEAAGRAEADRAMITFLQEQLNMRQAQVSQLMDERDQLRARRWWHLFWPAGTKKRGEPKPAP